MKQLLVGIVCNLLSVGVVSAQTCTGSLAFGNAPVHVGAEAAFSSNSHTFAGGVAGGNDTFFVRGAADLMSISNADSNAKGVLGSAGVEYPVDSEKKVFVCPIVTVSKMWGPNSPGFDFSNTLFAAGGSVGFVAAKNGNTTIVPTVALNFAHLSTTVTDSFLNNTITTTNGSSFGTLQFGAGFLFNDRMALVPSIIVPFKQPGGETAFGVLFTAKVGS